MNGISTPRMMRTRMARSLALGLLAISPALQAALPMPEPPRFEARSFLLEDFNSGKALAQSKADERMEPASITKMMTAYIVFSELRKGNLAMEDMVTVSEKAWRTGGSRMYIEVGSQVSVRDLLYGMIVQSGNDASVALAEHVAGSENSFAAWMNSYARDLGMTGTNYTNATGWPDDNHYSTAADIARLARALIEDFPEYYEIYSVKEFTYNEIRQYNRNKLLWQDDSVDGLKTGHTESAGYCLVSSAERDGMRLISVVLGTDSKQARTAASRALINYGFRFFDSPKLYDANTPITTVRPYKGAFDALDLGVAEDLYAPVPRGRAGDLAVQPEVPATLLAPIADGQTIGVLNILLDGEVVASEPLIALRAIPKGSLFQRLVDEVRLMIGQ